MAMLSIAIRPLVDCVACPDARPAWFAEDASSGGKLRSLRQGWDNLVSKGPAFGYHLNANNIWILVKKEHLMEARTILGGTGIRTTMSGVRHRDAPRSAEEYFE